MLYRLIATGACLAFLTTGCVTPLAEQDSKMCAAIGAIAGAGGGAVAANPRHGDDEPERYAVGAAVGAVAGGALGWLICGAPKPAMAPTARASADPASGQAPLSVSLQGVGRDEDGKIVSYAWDLGDGSEASGPRVNHTYQRPGRYTASLTVTDDDGLTGRANVPILVSEARAAAPPAPPPVKRRIILRGVTFAFDSAELRPDAEATLLAAVEVLNENPELRVEVAGHTDSTGPEAYNQGLSDRRARSVVQFLTERGITRGRLAPAGYGEGSPVADNGTRDGRAQNRRVELNVQE